MLTTSEILVSESHIDPLRDDGFVIYKLGYIHPVTAGVRDASMLWGNVKPPVGTVAQTVITFTATAAPTISGYNATYAATYGQYPKVVLLIDDGAGNELESQAVPVRNRTAGLLTSIVWDLGEAASGKIILTK